LTVVTLKEVVTGEKSKNKIDANTKQYEIHAFAWIQGEEDRRHSATAYNKKEAGTPSSGMAMKWWSSSRNDSGVYCGNFV
jgi:hypothetical protein